MVEFSAVFVLHKKIEELEWNRILKFHFNLLKVLRFTFSLIFWQILENNTEKFGIEMAQKLSF